MPPWIAALLALVVVAATVGAASGGFVAKLPAESSPQLRVTKHYDPLP